MWVIAAAIEVVVITVGATHPLVVGTEREGTSSVMPIFDSGTPLAGSAKSSPSADYLRDSARALVGQLLADSFARSLVVAEEEATRKAIILAAVILLPVPLAASAITTGWLWLRRLAPQRVAPP